MSNLDTPAAQWLAAQFEHEYCTECGGDTEHHTAVPFLGNWFARCDFAPNAAGNWHPTILTYREKADAISVTEDRNDRARKVLAFYADLINEPQAETHLCHLLTDMMSLAEFHRDDEVEEFNEALAGAQATFAAESGK